MNDENVNGRVAFQDDDNRIVKISRQKKIKKLNKEMSKEEKRSL